MSDPMPIPYTELSDRVLAGEVLSPAAALDLLQSPEADRTALLQATSRVREHHCGRRVKLCVLLNAQSGICQEDCHYCSQSRISSAQIEKYRLLPPETIVEQARQAADCQAMRFCIVMAARSPRQRDLDTLTTAISCIKADPRTAHLEICTSLGLLDADQCRQLKTAGVDYVNHNLNTGEQHYGQICSTHTYHDRLQTLQHVLDAGLLACSGGIVGMGESDEDLVEMGLALRRMGVHSIPINFLLGITGTPLQDQPPVDPWRALKVLCLMRLLNPDREIRVAAGRETRLGPYEADALCAANSLFVNGYLTTPGDPSAKVKAWIQAAGYQVEMAAPPVEEDPDRCRQLRVDPRS